MATQDRIRLKQTFNVGTPPTIDAETAARLEAERDETPLERKERKDAERVEDLRRRWAESYSGSPAEFDQWWRSTGRVNALAEMAQHDAAQRDAATRRYYAETF